jgi:ABC-type branched-subunit amino acid transport system substrate-binding protein
VERNTVKVQDAVKTINAAQPDGVIMISAYTSIAEFVREMKAAGSTTQFHNVSFVGSTALADALKDEGYGVAISQVVPFPWSPSVPVVKEYEDVLAKAGHADFNFSSLEGYVVGKVVVEALRRAGKEPTREKLVTALEGMSNVDLGDFIVSFSPTNHSGSKFVDLTMIGRNGKFLK